MNWQALRSLRGDVFMHVAGILILLVLYGIYEWTQTPSRLGAASDPNAQQTLKNVEVVSAELLRRPSGDVYAVITLKNANSFRVHDVQASCSAFDAVGRRLHTQQEQFKRLRSHGLMKFQRETSFRNWKITESIKCSVDSVRLSAGKR